jgi:hypothetical protein
VVVSWECPVVPAPESSANRKLSLPHPRGEMRLDGPQTSSGLLATNLPLLPRLLQLPVALRMDFLLPPSEDIVRRDVAGRAVQPDVVVTLYVTSSLKGDARGRRAA